MEWTFDFTCPNCGWKYTDTNLNEVQKYIRNVEYHLNALVKLNRETGLGPDMIEQIALILMNYAKLSRGKCIDVIHTN